LFQIPSPRRPPPSSLTRSLLFRLLWSDLLQNDRSLGPTFYLYMFAPAPAKHDLRFFFSSCLPRPLHCKASFFFFCHLFILRFVLPLHLIPPAGHGASPLFLPLHSPASFCLFFTKSGPMRPRLYSWDASHAYLPFLPATLTPRPSLPFLPFPPHFQTIPHLSYRNLKLGRDFLEPDHT